LEGASGANRETSAKLSKSREELWIIEHKLAIADVQTEIHPTARYAMISRRSFNQHTHAMAVQPASRQTITNLEASNIETQQEVADVGWRISYLKLCTW
jgi:hypothetical protein